MAAPAAALLSGEAPVAGTRSLVVAEPPRSTLVLGSTQPGRDADAVTCAARGVDVVRRRSGGGAVLVEPGRTLWVEVSIPAGDDLWCDDVGRAFLWLGRAWAAALTALGVDGLAVHDGAPVGSGWERRICFAGVGPGEVTVAGRKAVGIAQRRTRSSCLFQCAVPLGGQPAATVDLLALTPAERAAARAAVSERAVPLGGPLRGITPAALEDAFLASLPGATVAP